MAGLGRWLEDFRRPALPEPVVAEPILRRLSYDELAVVEAADLFNASDYRRTVGGIAKSLGAPRASIVQLPGVNAEARITVAWDISWYQYRVSPDAPQPVRLEQRGHDLSDLPRSTRAGTRISRATAASSPRSSVCRPGLAPAGRLVC